MCLTVDRKHHKKTKVYPVVRVPRIAGYDILVWKWLEPCYPSDDQRRWRSPYKRESYWFGCMKEMSGYLTAVESYYSTDVGAGIHAYQTKPKHPTRVYFPAIIPAGTKFFIGKYNEIVAERMTVYKTIDSMQRRIKRKGDLSKHKYAVMP